MDKYDYVRVCVPAININNNILIVLTDNFCDLENKATHLKTNYNINDNILIIFTNAKYIEAAKEYNMAYRGNEDICKYLRNRTKYSDYSWNTEVPDLSITPRRIP